MMDDKITRRELLLTTGAVALAPGFVTAATLLETNPLTFLDGLLSREEIAMGERELAPYRPGVLQLDLVWEWRQALQARIGRGANLIAVTRWDKALLFVELAREAGFPMRQQRIARALFRTEVSRRAL